MENQTNDKIVIQNSLNASITQIGLQSADWDTALQNKLRNSNRYKNGQEVSLNVQLDHFKEYGPGTYLFFLFAKRIAVLFVILSVLTIPCLISNYLGEGLKNIGAGNSKIYFMQFSLGNQLYNSTTISQSYYVSMMKINTYLITIPDVVYSLIFFLFFLHWDHDSTRITEQMKNESLLPSYFTVEIKNLPEDTNLDKIQNYMKQFGQIKQISEVKNYENSIEFCRQIYNKTLQLKQQSLKQKVNDQKVKQKQQNIQELYKKLSQQVKTNKTNGIIKYFLTFQNIPSRKYAIDELKKYNKICLCTTKIPQNLYFQNILPKISGCDIQPGSILWENIHITPFSRFIRYIFQMLIIILLIFLGFLLISLLNIASPQTTTNNIDISAYNYTTVIAANNADITQSWCLAQSISNYQSTQIVNLCYNIWVQYYSSVGLSIGVSIIVVVIKSILKIFIYYLSKFQRFQSFNQKTAYLIMNLFVTYIFTTVVITILLQANFLGISFKQIINKFITSTYLQTNTTNLTEYQDFNRSWYVDIGYKIVLSWLILTLVPHAYDPIILFFKEKINQCRARKQKFQKNMDLLLRGDQFRFQQHYANILLIVFISFGLSGPIPLLMILGTIALATRYIYYKYIFIRYCRLPPTFDQSLNTKIINILPYAAFLHLCISIYSYGNSEIFPHHNSGIQLIDLYATNLSSLTTNSFAANLMQRIILNWYLSLLLVIFIIVFLIKSILVDSIKWLINQCKSERIPTQLIKQNKQLIRNQQKDFIISYKIENNRHYRQILSILKSMKQSRKPDTEVL